MGVAEYTPADIECRELNLSNEREDPNWLANKIAHKHAIPVTELLGPCRMRHLVAARLELYRALRAPPMNWSFPAIGKFVGGRDHTTIICALASPERRARKAANKKVGASRQKPRA